MSRFSKSLQQHSSSVCEVSNQMEQYSQVCFSFVVFLVIYFLISCVVEWNYGLLSCQWHICHCSVIVLALFIVQMILLRFILWIVLFWRLGNRILLLCSIFWNWRQLVEAVRLVYQYVGPRSLRVFEEAGPFLLTDLSPEW